MAECVRGPPVRTASGSGGGSGGRPGYFWPVRLNVEFTTEPFDLDEAPPHAVVAREVVQGAALDAVDVGPFGNSAEGPAPAVLAAVDQMLRRSLEAGATRVSVQVNVLPDAPGSEAAPGGAGSGSGSDAGPGPGDRGVAGA